MLRTCMHYASAFGNKVLATKLMRMGLKVGCLERSRGPPHSGSAFEHDKFDRHSHSRTTHKCLKQCSGSRPALRPPSLLIPTTSADILL